MQTASPYSDWMAFAIEGNVRFIVPSYDAAPALRSFDLYNPQPPFSSQVAELANYTLWICMLNNICFWTVRLYFPCMHVRGYNRRLAGDVSQRQCNHCHDDSDSLCRARQCVS